MRPGSSESPFNAMPPAVLALAGLIAAVEVVLGLASAGILGGQGGVGWRISAVRAFGFFPDVLDLMMTTGNWSLWDAARFVTYPFVHGAFTSMLFAGAFLLALGKMVGEAAGGGAVLALFFGSAAVGALGYAALLNDPAPLIGAFPAVYGLIGGYTFLVWVRLGAMGEPQMQAFGLIGALMGIQLVFGLVLGAGNDWVADLIGFGTGFLMMPLVAKGGVQRLMRRLRER